MGFNIATARLGSVTEVWTTRQGDTEWHGLEIDFEKLRQQKHFKTPHIVRPKADVDQHGTDHDQATEATATDMARALGQPYAIAEASLPNIRGDAT